MPQIDSIDTFINVMDKMGILHSSHYGYTDRFKVTQAEGFDQEKVDKIASELPDPDGKPIIVSSDDFILDGHHRFLASLKANSKLNYIDVGLPINKLLKVVYDFL